MEQEHWPVSNTMENWCETNSAKKRRPAFVLNRQKESVSSYWLYLMNTGVSLNTEIDAFPRLDDFSFLLKEE